MWVGGYLFGITRCLIVCRSDSAIQIGIAPTIGLSLSKLTFMELAIEQRLKRCNSTHNRLSQIGIVKPLISVG